MLPGVSVRFSDGGDPGWNIVVPIRGRYYVLHSDSETAARTLSSMMDIFFYFSGLQLNRAKSIFVGLGLSTEEASRCTRLLATPIGTLLVQYLDLPLADKRLRVQD